LHEQEVEHQQEERRHIRKVRKQIPEAERSAWEGGLKKRL